MKRLYLKEAQKMDLDRNTSWVRLIEMKLEGLRNLGIMVQFFADWEIYGLREALIYLKGYEDNGEVPRGTFDSINEVSKKIEGRERRIGL